MKILSITAQKPHSTGSGVYLTELVKGFTKLGHEQAVIAGIYEEDVTEFPEGVKLFPVVFRTKSLPFAITGMSDEMPYESTRYQDMTDEMSRQFRLAFAECILQAVEEFRPELILCHHLYALTALVRELLPDMAVTAVCHGSDLRQIHKNSWRRQEIISGIRKLDAVFALHEVQRREIVELYDMEPDKVHVIGTGYNNDIFGPGAEESGSSRRGRILFAGKLSEKKGVKSLLRAFGYMGDVEILEITLAGSTGNDKEQREIERLAEVCPVRTVFAGRIPQNELAQQMREHEVFVLPSFYEGLPLVVVEALACGEKVVCTDLPGIRDWLDEHVRRHGVEFVEPPEIRGGDEPVEETLPAFERRLARAIEAALVKPDVKPEGLADISWKGICHRILGICRDIPSIF